MMTRFGLNSLAVEDKLCRSPRGTNRMFGKTLGSKGFSTSHATLEPRASSSSNSPIASGLEPRTKTRSLECRLPGDRPRQNCAMTMAGAVAKSDAAPETSKLALGRSEGATA
jgi:hypothetical protein